MSLREKPIDELAEPDLQQLITDRVRESQTLEFKKEPYGRNDDQVKEMLKDISSMANAFGGDLVIGIEEDGEGVAIGLTSVQNAEEEARRIVSSCLSNLEEHIPGLRALPIPLSNARYIIVIRIPRSLRAPHMITFRGLNQFWLRHDRQKSPMSIHEIRETCLRIEGLMEKLERFLEKRKSEILTEIGDFPYYIVSLTPILADTEIVDIRDKGLRALLHNPPNQRPNGWTVPHGCPTHPTLHGLITEVRDCKALELFSNAHVELRVKIDQLSFYLDEVDIGGQKHPVFGACPLVEYPVSLLRLSQAIYAHCGLTDPAVVSLSLFNIDGFALANTAENFPQTSPVPGFRPRPWGKKHLEIPPRRVPLLDQPDRIAKQCVDRLWQAFNYEQAPLFDAEGNFRPQG